MTNSSSFYLSAFFPGIRGGGGGGGRSGGGGYNPLGLLNGNCCVHVSPESSTTEEGVDINNVYRVILF